MGVDTAYKLFIDRPNTPEEGVDGLLTLRGPDIAEGEFTRLPIRVGQAGYGGTSWIRARSPIPFLKDVLGKKLYLWTKPNKNGLTYPLSTAPGGIGWFFPISSSKDNPNVIMGRNGNKRTYVGLHGENAYPGSAGCPVLLWRTPKEEQRAVALLKKLESLGAAGHKTVEVWSG